MKIRPWLAGALGVTAVTFGLGTTASAATHHAAAGAVQVKGFLTPHARLAGPLLRHPAGTVGVIYNPVWGGYVDPAVKNVQLRYVGADFNVPSINCANSPAGTLGPAAVVEAVGLDGFSDAAYEATGVDATCNGTTPQYSGWYQIGTAVHTSAVAVGPGDAIQASVYYNSSTRQYNFILTDATLGQPLWNTTAACPSGSTCANSSAEAITGAANGVPPQYTLADFGMANFTGGAVTSRDGVKGGFGPSKLWGSFQMIMRDSTDQLMITPSSLGGGTAFSTTWHTAT